jgi:hypothetical protein
MDPPKDLRILEYLDGRFLSPWSAGHGIRVLAVNEFARDTKIRNV